MGTEDALTTRLTSCFQTCCMCFLTFAQTSKPVQIDILSADGVKIWPQMATSAAPRLVLQGLTQQAKIRNFRRHQAWQCRLLLAAAKRLGHLISQFHQQLAQPILTLQQIIFHGHCPPKSILTRTLDNLSISAAEQHPTETAKMLAGLDPQTPAHDIFAHQLPIGARS